MAVDVETKYILNAIPYLGRNKIRAPSHRLFDWIVMNLMEPYRWKEEMLQLTTSFPRSAWPSNCGRRRRELWERSIKSEESYLDQQKQHERYGTHEGR